MWIRLNDNDLYNVDKIERISRTYPDKAAGETLYGITIFFSDNSRRTEWYSSEHDMKLFFNQLHARLKAFWL